MPNRYPWARWTDERLLLMRFKDLGLLVIDEQDVQGCFCHDPCTSSRSAYRTPNIDRIAAEGMRFTDHYAGSTVCAPSRLSSTA